MTEHTKHTTFADIFKLFEHLTSDDARENAGAVLLDAFRLIVEHASELSRMTTSAVRSTTARTIASTTETAIRNAPF